MGGDSHQPKSMCSLKKDGKGKEKKTDSPLQTLKGMQSCQQLDQSPDRPTSGGCPSKLKDINSQCFKHQDYGYLLEM